MGMYKTLHEQITQCQHLISFSNNVFMQTRKFKELLESRLGWEFQKKSDVDGIYFDEDDEVNVEILKASFAFSLFFFWLLMDFH